MDKLSQDVHLCGPCMYDHITKSAKKWCLSCEEGYCADCEPMHKSAEKDHTLISMEDYCRMLYSTFEETCKEHEKRLKLFCRNHDSVICTACVRVHHMSCSNIILLEEAARNAKSSTALFDLEEAIKDVLKNVRDIIADRDVILKDVKRQQTRIRKEVSEIRQKVNKYLEDCEITLLQELTTKYEKCKGKTDNALKHLKLAEEMSIHLNKQTEQIKSLTTETQVFLGTRALNKKLLETVNSIRLQVGTLENYNLNLQVNPALNSMLSEINGLGNIRVESTCSELSFLPLKINQTQVMQPKPKPVSELTLSLKEEIEVKKEGYSMSVTGCLILPNGQLVIADRYGKNQLMLYSHDGSHLWDIPLSASPHDLALINNKRIAVSYGAKEYVEIINTKKMLMEKRIEVSKRCYGISYQSGKLYIVVLDQGIVVMDLTGKVLDTIKVDVKFVENLTTSPGMVFYSDYKTHTVKCCTTTGEQIWEFQDASLKTPRGLALDSFQNVFVLGILSNNLTVVSHDGKTSKTLLTIADGLSYPASICYNKDQNDLLVCNSANRNIFLYKVN